MNIEIDTNSGFCFGVVYAIDKAEKILEHSDNLYCLGDIVHNDAEVARLESKGLQIIDKEQLSKLKNKRVMFRAHGESPETYLAALKNNITVVDASCPIVLKLQLNIKKKYDQLKPKNGQIIIFGKKGHAEVIALSGQINNEAIIISNEDDLKLINFALPIAIFSQTTKSRTEYNQIVDKIKSRLITDDFYFQNSICNQVADRDKKLKKFCKDKDLIIFVSGKKSSNGKMLYGICCSINPNTKFISEITDIDNSWLDGVTNIGITGATSTPKWLMENVKNYISSL